MSQIQCIVQQVYNSRMSKAEHEQFNGIETASKRHRNGIDTKGEQRSNA
ncbi:hypothetical protein HJC23_002080 [Cyclotella cryptica]|uniref:Uncharacterized protein n=1 Tax=Cyclotella cryptica TaxID=29204 RepID=A0ABD3Q6C2_9STRA